MSRKRKVETITKVVSNQECSNHRRKMSTNQTNQMEY